MDICVGGPRPPSVSERGRYPVLASKPGLPGVGATLAPGAGDRLCRDPLRLPVRAA